jgi:SAM-dependent methyltransferase
MPDMTFGDSGDAGSPRRAAVDLFLISFLILFLELAAIRWFGSMVVFLTFFTNIVLLASFLGMSVGCLAASRRENLVERAIPVLLVAVVLAEAVLFIHTNFGAVMIDVGGQGSPQQIYFGTEFRARDVSRFVVPIEAVAAVFFVLIAMVFVGLGQVMGRGFDRIPDRIRAYTLNISGSLTGIVAFALLSYLRTPPEIWFAIALALCLSFVPRTPRQVTGVMAIVIIVGLSAHLGPFRIIWSPYYKVTYAAETGVIATNNIGHQRMVSVAKGGPGYLLPHLLNRDAGGVPFADVLVIGAGSGNDVDAALRQGAAHVDAVEIDPVMNEIGRNDHPDRPYSDPRVTIHIEDGRSFLRSTSRQYDLIVYALVDSLVLHSGYSTLRLESFLFTREAFEDIRARLKPGGIFAAYNYYRQGWLVGRLTNMMTDVFGSPPLVMSLPYVDRIGPDDAQVNRITFLLAGVQSPSLGRIRQQFAGRFFWINNAPERNDAINGFLPQPPSLADAPTESWEKIGLADVEARARDQVPTDDWPFLYLLNPTVPTLNLRGIAVMAVCSLGVLYWFAPPRRVRPNWRMFFLGAGFMLLETKGVVHLALLFGSTWIVNSIVFFAILVMILLSNLYVLLVRPTSVWPYYLLVAASLITGSLIPIDAFLSLQGPARVLASCAIVFVPVFFAGIVFATTFRDSRQPDIDIGSNIAGAMAGGLSEPLSLMIGFGNLLLVALILYGCSWLLGRKGGVAPALPG